MELNLRNETPADYRTVEELTRDAFWGSMDHPAQLAAFEKTFPLKAPVRLPPLVPSFSREERSVGAVPPSRVKAGCRKAPGRLPLR